MAEEFQRIEGVHTEGVHTEVVQSELVTHAVMTTETSVPAVDWDAPPVYVEHETIVATSVVAPADTAPVVPVRGQWDFTDAQRIILALLIWLNILVLGVGYLALTGQLLV